MKLDDVVFPASYDGLAGMSSAELRVLVGKLPNGAELHPKIASMGYHMPKADRVTFIGHHYYGVGSADQAAAALAGAETKYAAHQAKKGAKTGLKTPAPAPAGTTNCTATVANTLTTLASNVPKATSFAANLDSWAGKLVGKPSAFDLKQWGKQLAETADIPPSTKADLAAFLDEWADTAAKVEGHAAGTVTDNALWYAGKILEKPGPEIANLLPKAQAMSAVDAAEAVATATASSVSKVEGIFDAFITDDIHSWLNALVDLVDPKTVDIFPDLSPQAVKALSNLVANGADDVAALIVNQADEIGDGLTTLAPKLDALFNSAKVPPTLKATLHSNLAEPLATITAAADDAAALAAEVAAEVASGAAQAVVDAAQATYAAMSKAELKKIGPAAFKDAGVDVPSLAHYLTKDELATALAKLDAGEPITDLLDVAQAKKVAHKAKATTTQAAVKDADHAADVPSLAAHPDTAAVTDLTVPEVTTKTAAKKAATPSTPAEVEALPVPEGGPPPGAVGVPQSKYPKPAQVEHSFTYKPSQANLGGAHTKAQYLDEDQEVWMWKKAEAKGVAEGEALAHDIGWDLGFDMADIRYAPGWEVPGKGTFPHGTVQKFHHGVKGNMDAVPVGAMTPEQLAELQEHQVFDWLISQHDTHSENILVMADGHLAPIDKGQAFKFFGKDRLEVGYSPPGNFGKPVYYDMWDQYAAGRLDLDLDAIDGILARIDQLSDVEYTARIRAYAAQRVADGGGLKFLPANLRTVDAMTDAIVGRKQSIRAEFTEFYRAQAKRRGVEWNPIWEQRLDAVTPEVLAEVGPAAAAAGITTPVTSALAADVERFGMGGKALHLAGKDVRQGQALVFTEQAADGSKVLRMELRLGSDAEDRVTALLRGLKDDTGYGSATGHATAGGGGYMADPLWDNVLAMAKTVGAHADDGAYNMQTVVTTNAHIFEAAGKAADLAKKAADALAAGKVDDWAKALAEAEQNAHYVKAHAALKAAMDAGVKPPFPIEKFDLAKAIQGFKANAPAAPATTTVEPAAGLFKTLEVGRDAMQRTEPTKDFLGFKRTGETPDVMVGSNGYSSGLGHADPGARSVGRQFNGTMDIDGTTVTVRYRGYDMTAAVPRKGLMDLEIEGWTGGSDDIEKLLAAVERLGVDTRLATAEDEALTYWRTLTGSMKQSVEYASPSTDPGYAASPYARIRATIDAMEAKVAAAGNLPSSAEADIYREAFTELFGSDAVARAPERITHRRNVFGEEMGLGHARRFDLPEDLSPAWDKSMAGHIHGSRRITPDQFSTYDGTASTSELVRAGTIKLDGSTTSAESDLFTGGANGTFAAPGWSHYATGNDFVIGRPAAIDARATTYAFGGDRYGAMGERVRGNYLDPARSARNTVGGGESITRDSISFGEDVEAVVVRSMGKRDEMLADLRALGVTEIRGRPIEERVLYAQTDTEAKKIIRDITKNRRESMFNPYADLPGSPRPEPGLPAKPKRVHKKAAPKPPPEPDVPLATSATPPDPFGPTSIVDSGDISNAFADAKPAYGDLVPQTAPEVAKHLESKLTLVDGVTKAQAKAMVDQAFGAIPPGVTLTPPQQLKWVADFGANYHGLTKGLASLGDDVAKKVDWLLETPGAGATQHLAELAGYPNWNAATQAWHTDGPGMNLTAWLKDVAVNGPKNPPNLPPTIAAADHAKVAEVFAKLKDVNSLADEKDLVDFAAFKLHTLVDGVSQADAEAMANKVLASLKATYTDAELADLGGEYVLEVFSSTGANYMNLIKPLSDMPSLNDKVYHLLMELPGSESGMHLQDFLGPKWLDEFGASGDSDMVEWALAKAAANAKAAPATTSLQVPMGTLKAAPAGSNGETVGLLHAVTGDPVMNDAVAPTSNYVVPGLTGPLPVQYIEMGGSFTKVIAQHLDGKWYLVDTVEGPKPSKAAVVESLKKLGWPGVAP